MAGETVDSAGREFALSHTPPTLLDRVLMSTRWKSRRSTSRLRRYPDFIVIGGQRTGTTSLFHSLAEHPRLTPSFRKEVHYFDIHYVNHDQNWYRANFPLRGPSEKLAYEATPNYLAHPDTPKAMKSLLPDVKLIALLRNPVERTYSSWRFLVYRGLEQRTFREAIDSELAGGAEEENHSPRKQTGDMRFAYLRKSRYAEHLERWLTFYDRSQMLIVKSEDLFQQPAKTMERILGFVDLVPSPKVSMQHIHATPSTSLSTEDRLWLEEYFEPHNRRLEDLLGEKFDWS